MKHFKTIVSKSLIKAGQIGCGECQASCQSACKTSCTVGNQICKRDEKINIKRNSDKN
ncbi:MAG: six-cysteine ranthipeptide SCIFF [Christensenellaceae bacterium]|nr:six-cysteine ranthipeptide SCIFF [Christensenellaceae bacterium]